MEIISKSYLLLYTVETINSIVENSTYSEHTKTIWGLSVITGKSSNLKDILLHNKELGIKHMQMKCVRLEKDDEFSINEKNLENILGAYKELIDYFIECASNHDYSDLKLILNDNDYFGKLMCRIIDGGMIYSRCKAGIDKISFDAMGNIYPCDSFVGNKDFIMGNIYTGIDNNIREKFKMGTINERTKCKSCWAKYICGGDCFHNSYLTNNDILDPDPIFCQLNKNLLESALYLYFCICKNGDINKLQSFIKIKKRLYG